MSSCAYKIPTFTLELYVYVCILLERERVLVSLLPERYCISEQKAKRGKYETNHERAKRSQLHCLNIIMKLHLRIHIHPDLKIIKIKASSPYKNPNLRKTIEGY